MGDRELLELAAKAAGYEYKWIKRIKSADGESLHIGADRQWIQWNPLDDDGDALRLAVKLEIDILITNVPYVGLGRTVSTVHDSDKADVTVTERADGDPCAATRRAIVRAAAELAKGAT